MFELLRRKSDSLLPPVSYASSSVVVNDLSYAKEQSSGNASHLRCLATHALIVLSVVFCSNYRIAQMMPLTSEPHNALNKIAKNSKESFSNGFQLQLVSIHHYFICLTNYCLKML